MRWIKGLILAVILLVVMLVGILFAVNNQQAIALNLIWAELPAVSLSVWLLATLAVDGEMNDDTSVQTKAIEPRRRCALECFTFPLCLSVNLKMLEYLGLLK